MRTLFLFVLLTLISGLAFGQAVEFTPNCRYIKTQIQDPNNSNGYYFSRDCHTVYVLPPTIGQIKIRGVQDQFDAETCRAYTTPLDILQRHEDALNQASRELARAAREVQARHGVINTLKKSCDQIDGEVDQLQKTSDELTSMKTAYQDDKQALKSQIASCLKKNGGESVECERLQQTLTTINDVLDKMDNAIYRVAPALALAKVDSASCANDRDKRIREIVNQDSQFQAASNKFETESQNLEKALDSELSGLIRSPGGNMSVTVESNQYNMVQQYKTLNSKLAAAADLTFVPMPINKGVISFDWITDGLTANIPTIIRSDVFGLSATNGERSSLGAQMMTKGDANMNVLFGNAAGAELQFNLYTACRLLQATPGEDMNDLLKNIASELSMTMTFRYALQAHETLHVRYSESELYKLMKESSTSSGLFTSSTATSLTESSNASQWIIVHVTSDDPKAEWPHPEKMALDIRQQYLNRALMKVATSYLTSQQAQQLEPGADGAAKASQVLHKCTYLYCQYAAFGLDLGNALFGGSDSSASTTRAASAVAEQVVKITQPVQHTGTQAYEVKL